MVWLNASKQIGAIVTPPDNPGGCLRLINSKRDWLMATAGAVRLCSLSTRRFWVYPWYSWPQLEQRPGASCLGKQKRISGNWTATTAPANSECFRARLPVPVVVVQCCPTRALSELPSTTAHNPVPHPGRPCNLPRHNASG